MEDEEASLNEDREMIKEPLLIKNPPPPKGGFRALPFIIGNGMIEKIASFGVMPNMPLYLMRQYHMEMTSASTLLFYWSAMTNSMPVFGAILADSFVGRFHMIGFGSLVCFLGMTLLWIISMLPQVKPPPCDQLSSNCKSSTAPQLLLLCLSFALISIGGGGIRSSSLAFGADQLETEHDSKDAGMLERYFGWYYASYTLGILIALTCIVYIQEALGWEYGFGVCAVLMACSVVVFFIASPFYVRIKAKASLVVELCQVIVASCKKLRLESSSSGTVNMYHTESGSNLFFPTERLRFLNKAAIIGDPHRDLTPEGRAADPWSLCTVDQVEELKALVRVIPIWSSGMLTFVNASQGSFAVLQASSMNRKIGSGFEIPVGSFGTFAVLFVILWVPFYDKVILPIASKIRGKPVHLSPKHRMGIGIFISYLCVVVTAVVEGIRRNRAIQQGLLNDPNTLVNMSALWLIPQNCLLGLAEGLNAIAQNEFYISELPKSMASIAANLCTLGTSLGGVMASVIMNTVDNATKNGGGEEESWVSSNINKGHYDYYFWVLSGLSMVNLMYFVVCCWLYGPCKAEESKGKDEEEGVY